MLVYKCIIVFEIKKNKLEDCEGTWQNQVTLQIFNPFHSDGLHHIYWYNRYGNVHFVFYWIAGQIAIK